MTLTSNQLKWIEALESDEYKQGRSYLCTLDSNNNKCYCCLGVVCELFNIESVLNSKSFFNNRYLYFENESEVLPQQLLAAIGLNNVIGEPLADDSKVLEVIKFIKELHPSIIFNEADSVSIALTNLNDAGLTFKEIAAVLRKFSELYFKNYYETIKTV